MSKRLFGDFSKIVSKDELKPALCHLVIQDGLMVGTNSHILIYLPISAWVDDEQKIANLEGKAIHLNILKRMCLIKWNLIDFTQEKIILMAKDGSSEQYYYSAQRDRDNKYLGINPVSGESDPSRDFTFPAWRSVVPELNNVPEGEFFNLGINPRLLVDLESGFPGTTQGLELRFVENRSSSTAKCPTRGVEVLPIYASGCAPEGWENFKGLIMPIFIKK